MADRVSVGPEQEEVDVGRPEYRSVVIPNGQGVEVWIMVAGQKVASLCGPWTARSRPGCHAMLQVRVRVYDDSPRADLVAEQVAE